jgi:hypothetical protein
VPKADIRSAANAARVAPIYSITSSASGDSGQFVRAAH